MYFTFSVVFALVKGCSDVYFKNINSLTTPYMDIQMLNFSLDHK